MAVFMQPIFTQTLSSSVANISFNNIPQGFTDLKIVVSARGTSSAVTQEMYTVFNDSSSQYSQTRLYGTGSAVGSYYLAGYGGYVLQPIPAATATANTFSNSEYYIANYSRAVMKQMTVDFTAENNTTATDISLYSNAWQSSAPITKITFAAGGGLIAANSTFTIYGISPVYDTAVPVAPTINTVTDQAGFVSVEFTPSANDRADSYVVTSNPAANTTYGATSPIVTPAALNTAYTYRVASVNSLGNSTSAFSDSLTTDNSYASIATVPFTNSTTSNASFLNIPQNYKHLQLRCFVRMTSSQSTPYDLTVTVNGSNAANYSYHTLRGDGANPGSTGLNNDNVFRFPVSVPNASMTSNVFGVLIIDLPDYRDISKFKTVRSLWGYDNTSGASPTAGWTGNTGSAWQSLEPITSLIVASFGNFAQYSHVALYGIA